MNNSSSKMIVRKLFQNKVYSSDGQSYEDLFSKVMIYANKNFRPVRPQGSKGDKKNDGYIDLEGIFYQVYAPEKLENKIKASIDKLYNDFEVLYTSWSNIKKFYYVLNDKYKATYPDIEFALKDIQNKYKIECKPFLSKDLEEVFMNLKEDQIKMIIGDYIHENSIIYEVGYKFIKLHRNKNFIGRSDYITGIRKYLLQNDGINTVVIKGLAGKGKTQTALEYTFQYEDDYSIILWINAESTETLTASYLEIFNDIGFTLEGIDTKDKVDKIKQILEGSRSYNSKWLLVFDNATDEDALSDYIPTTGSGDVIITSQSDHWFNVGLPLSLGELPKKESFILLKNYSLVNDEQEAIAELCHELGYLPLALVQAGSYIRMAKTNVAKYLEDFRIERKRQYLLSTSSPIKTKNISHDYNFVISTVWKKTFDNIKKNSPFSGEILQMLSFISTSVFPLEQLRLLIDFSSENIGNNDSDKVIAWLTNFSLITLHGKGITIHTLVQTVTRDNMNTEDKNHILSKLSKGISSCARYANDGDKKYLEEMNLLIPHYYKIASFLEENEICINYYIEILYMCGKFRSRESFMFDEANITLNKCLPLLKQRYGKNLNSPTNIRNYYMNLLRFYNEIAFIHEQMGYLEDSIKLYQKCVELSEDIYGENSMYLMNNYNNLAVNYNHLGKHNEAYNYFQKCLELSKKYNMNEINTLTIYNNIGSTLASLGKFEEASNILIETIKRTEEIYGKEDFRLANLYNNYAEILAKYDRFEDAIKYYEKSLKVSESRYLDKNPHKEKVLNNMGLIYTKMYKIERAREVFDEALESIFSIYGETHLSTAKTYSNIGLAYMEIDNYKTAKDFFYKSLSIGEKVYLKPHPEMGKFFNNLGWAHQELDELEEAEKFLLKSIEIFMQVFDSEEYPEFATAYINLGKVYLYKGLKMQPKFFEKARIYFEKGLSIDIKIYGEESMEVTIDRVNYAQLLTQNNENLLAIEYCEKALRIYKKNFGELHPRIGELYFFIGINYYILKKYNLSKRNFEKAVFVFSKYSDNKIRDYCEYAKVYLNNLS
ncbi:tetratricopeptide repeat protein [Paenibacillus silvae]|uniref:tetratricopeptide repeat protein n=1 Tax=Paenibacillus silvae TaxID=1325358 RepID=UPI0025A2CDA0|nr:tetratricopeptide repeat protein [Paenibacillus silvae]MDM5276699.1 tetratricopeptide repeat protein [Paenibacillus silvae]